MAIRHLPTTMASSGPGLPLRACTYNAQGLTSGASWEYLNELMKTNDVLFVQETWLRTSQDHLFADNVRRADFVAVSAMDDADLASAGRPHGGCAIVWNSSLCCSMVPVSCNAKRACAVKCTLPNMLTCLLYCVYMPCDTLHDHNNVDEFNCILSEFERLVVDHDVDYVICAGDFNTDFSRSASLHTDALCSFLRDSELCVLHDLPVYNVPFTYESKINGVRSTLDHMFVSQNMYDQVRDVYVSFNVANDSDHYPLHVYFDIDIGVKSHPRSRPPKQLWARTTEACRSLYAQDLEIALAEIDVPLNAIECRQMSCNNPEHRVLLQEYHDAVVDCCIRASSCVPKSSCSSRIVPGWNRFVKPFLEKALFWHSLWILNGRPQYGVVADVRRSTRARYHKEVKRVKAMESIMRSTRMADRFAACQVREFWNDVARTKGGASELPSSVGDAVGDAAVAELFRDNYSTLYKSVAYDPVKLENCMDEVSNRIENHNECTAHSVLSGDVVAAVNKLKRNKHDGNRGLYTDHLKNAPRILSVHLGHLFNSCLVHGFSPTAFGESVLVPIPKSKLKSRNDLSNYRSIALSSILNKVLDKIFIEKCKAGFSTSHYQFGFKQRHSTAQCSFVVNEVVQHYVNSGSTVYACLLDASKAFDRIAYCTLFDVLLTKGICPVIIRFLYHLYLNQTAVIRWGNEVSESFQVDNGVKQGGVLSPVLFTVYLDELLVRLSKSRAGCYLESTFAGAYAYADDIILLSPSVLGLVEMLKICELYANEFQVIFNASKSKLVVINGPPLPGPLPFMGGSVDQVAYERHLGFRFGNSTKGQWVDDLCKQMIIKANMLKAHFVTLPYDVMYALFKTYCMPLYGVQMLDFEDRTAEKLFLTWRKCIRSILCLPPRTHSKYLPLICDDLPIHKQLIVRFVKFFCGLRSSHNPIVSRCAQLALRGSGSNVSNSLSVVSHKYNVNRLQITLSQVKKSQECDIDTEHNSRMASFVQDLLDARWTTIIRPNQNNFLSLDEINALLYIACTE